MKNKICVVSGSRADCSLLKVLIIKLNSSEFFDFQLILTGSHLSKKHGYTINEIAKDDIQVNKQIRIITKTDKKEDIGYSVSSTIKK